MALTWAAWWAAGGYREGRGWWGEYRGRWQWRGAKCFCWRETGGGGRRGPPSCCCRGWPAAAWEAGWEQDGRRPQDRPRSLRCRHSLHCSPAEVIESLQSPNTFKGAQILFHYIPSSIRKYLVLQIFILNYGNFCSLTTLNWSTLPRDLKGTCWCLKIPICLSELCTTLCRLTKKNKKYNPLRKSFFFYQKSLARWLHLL